MTAPAIRRDWDESDTEAELIGCHYSDVSRIRGLGDSGRKVETVEYDCPHHNCRSDRMVRLVRIAPDHHDSVEYYCLYPGCPHFVSDTLNWARDHSARTPTKWQQSTVCPDCGDGDTIVVTDQQYDTREKDSRGRLEVYCDECHPRQEA